MISSRGNQMDLDSDEFDLFDDTSSEPSRRHHSSVASKPMDFSCSQVRLDFSSSSAFELFWSELRLPSPSSSLSMLAEFSQSNVSVITRLSSMCTEWKQAILPFTIVHSIFSTASSTQLLWGITVLPSAFSSVCGTWQLQTVGSFFWRPFASFTVRFSLRMEVIG